MYKVVFDYGGEAFIDDVVLRTETTRRDPFGILHWLDVEVCWDWKSVEKVEAEG